MRAKCNQGFTLLEVMIAMIVLSIGLVGLLSMSAVTLQRSDENEQWTTARMLAENYLDDIASRTHQSLWQEPEPVGSETETINAQTYTVEWTISPQGGANDPIEVRVRVEYPGFNNWVELATMRTFFM